jgi:hypothetical protein
LNAAWTEEERPESEEEPIAECQVRRPLARAAQDDQLLFEQEILRDHGAPATRATQPRDPDGQVQQREEEIPHVRVSVRQASGAMQRCRMFDSARELAIRDPQVGPPRQKPIRAWRRHQSLRQVGLWRG